jgi:ABC-2 type transport system ATP-binding protein
MAPTKGIIISTHILEEVDAVCTRAVIIARGKLLFSGTPSELAARSTYHQAVTLSVPAADAAGLVIKLKSMPGVTEVGTADSGDSHLRLTVRSELGGGLFARLQAEAQAGQWPVREMFVEGGRLDEVFRTITTSAAPTAGGLRS